MIAKILTVSAVLLMSACSSAPKVQHKSNTASAPVARYVNAHNTLVPENVITSSNNECVDRFNFLRSAGSSQYGPYSHDYGKISKGFAFLNTNKNIMGTDARDVYSLKLDTKLDTLCNRVDHTGYEIIKGKMSELKDI